MRKEYRAVNFDLNTDAMQQVLGSKTKGYGLIKKSMENLGFEHRQGSGYRSLEPMTRAEAETFTHNLGRENPWLADCVKTFDITNSGIADYDFTDILRNAAYEAAHDVDGANAHKGVKALSVDEFINAMTPKAQEKTVPIVSASADSENVMD